jgi:putative ABC transport system permease protein
MRSALTMLGIVIGVAAVIAMVTLGQGATDKVTNDIAQMGTNLLIVSPGSERRGPTASGAAAFTVADVTAIEREVPSVAAVAPVASRNVLAVVGNTNWSTTATGSTADYFTVRGYELADGRAFTPGEEGAGTPVCVLGATVGRELFAGQDPLGASLRLGTLSCEVVGVLAAKGESTFGQDQDDFVVLPLRAFQRRIAGTLDVGMMFVSAASDRATARAQSDIEALLRERRRIGPGEPPDFRVQDMKEIARTMQTVTGVLTALLGSIAAVSLLVGGIGIMNVMLVSVTERTREIGIRLSVGARGRDVLLQFLVEAVVLSTIGGLIGMVLGLSGSYVAGRALGLPFTILPRIILLAFAFSVTVGVAFGFYPARKAARLNPIEALRHE